MRPFEPTVPPKCEQQNRPQQPATIKTPHPGWLAALREAIHPRGPDAQAEEEVRLGDWRLHMLGAVLHMRGPEPRCVHLWLEGRHCLRMYLSRSCDAPA